MHPLVSDLTKLTDDELHSKRGELQNKLSFAYRTGNSGLVGQIQMLIQDYSLEAERRNQKMLDELSKNGKSFADKINITK